MIPCRIWNSGNSFPLARFLSFDDFQFSTILTLTIVVFEKTSYDSKLKLFIKNLLFKKRNDLLKESISNEISLDKIVRRKKNELKVFIKNWVSLIDYVYIRACLETDSFIDLFKLLRTSGFTINMQQVSNIKLIISNIQMNNNNLDDTRSVICIELNYFIKEYIESLKLIKGFLINSNSKRLE